ncbi:MAG: DUF2062 domain-containing protein [Alphaproteobacteria bacterium]|nr:DUF2062 domain-containing protein [Alphaproteobacteria bacterium]
MFRRRHKPSWTVRLRNMVWPEGGWKRYGQYILLRLNRLKGTPQEIAAGAACGVAISFTPFVGFHFVLAAITAWLVRGNILASALGTAAGNPWTFPFIWISVLYTGRRFLGLSDVPGARIDFLDVFEKGMHALMTFDFSMFFHDIWPVLWPMTVGCVPFYIVSWLLSYYLLKIALEKIAARRKGKKA